MDIRNKAQWHLDTNGGFMPIFENTDGHLVYESAVIMAMASTLAKPGEGLPIWPHEACEPGDAAGSFKTAQMRLDMLDFDKFGYKLFGPLITRFKEQEKIAEFEAVLPQWEEFVKKQLNGNSYLSGGDQPMMIDFHCYPIFERAVMLENSPWDSAFTNLDFKNKCPTVYEYVHRFRQHEVMKEHCFQPQHYNNLMNEYDAIEGKAPLSHTMVEA